MIQTAVGTGRRLEHRDSGVPSHDCVTDSGRHPQNEHSRRDLVKQSAASRAGPLDLEAIHNIRGTSALSRGFYLLMRSRTGCADQVGSEPRTTLLPHRSGPGRARLPTRPGDRGNNKASTRAVISLALTWNEEHLGGRFPLRSRSAKRPCCGRLMESGSRFDRKHFWEYRGVAWLCPSIRAKISWMLPDRLPTLE